MTKLKIPDLLILLPSVCISIIGLFLLLAGNKNLFYAQLIFTFSGLTLFVIVANIDFRIWQKTIHVFYLISIFLLIIIFFLPEVRGAHRWIDFHYFVIQTSEVIKPVVILIFASLLSRYNRLDFKIIMGQISLFLPL